MEQLLLILTFTLLGLAVGSFLNLCADRLPVEQSVISNPSHCPACKHRLGFSDLVPFFNYLWLGGRCRYCKAPIPSRLPIVELTTGLLFGLLYWKFGLGFQLGVSLVYAGLLTIIFVIDLENRLVLDRVIYPGIAFAFVASFFWPELGAVRSLAGGALGFAVLFLPFILYRHGMGLGDVKLAVLIGLMAGYPLVIVALLLAILAGGLVAAFLLIFKLKKRKDTLPFAPFLATSTVITLLRGQAIWQWYLAWL